jgi:hypothetical protein
LNYKPIVTFLLDPKATERPVLEESSSFKKPFKKSQESAARPRSEILAVPSPQPSQKIRRTNRLSVNVLFNLGSKKEEASLAKIVETPIKLHFSYDARKVIIAQSMVRMYLQRKRYNMWSKEYIKKIY